MTTSKPVFCYRQLWLKAHISLALTLGFLIVLMGLAGSLSVYREELDVLLNPRLSLDNPQGQPLPLDQLFSAVRKAHPSRHGEWVLELPSSPEGMLTAWYERPQETFGEIYAPLMVSVNPYTAEIVANRFWGQTFATWVEDLHTRLHLGLFGAKLVGLLGLGLVTSVLSGLYLWWPRLAGWRSMFRLRHNQGLRHFAHDLHGLLGLASAVILLLLAFSGLHLAYPTLLETLAGASGMGHGEDGPEIRSTAEPNEHPVSLAEAAAIARGPFPHTEIRRIATPAGNEGTYRVNLRRPGEVNIRHPVTMVWIDRWSGQIREVRNPNRLSAGQGFVTRLWALHTGEYFGHLGRFLWFLAGFAPLLLYATGLSQWLIQRGHLQDRRIDWPEWQALRIKAIRLVQTHGPLLWQTLGHWGVRGLDLARRLVEQGLRGR